jgi:CRP/FNR family transcriptional regulator
MRFDSNFWDGIQKEFHPEILNICEKRSIKAQSFLFNDGETYLGFFIVIKGKFRLFNLSEKGDEATIAVQSATQVIALVPIFTKNKVNHAYCQAIENSDVYFLEKGRFIDLLMKHAELLYSVAEMVIHFTMGFREKYLSMKLKTPEDRLIDFMSELGAKVNFISLPISKKNIASLLDITPESLSRILLKLKNKKILDEANNTYKLN